MGEQDGAETEVPTRRTQMRDEEYSSEHVPAYGSQERPAIAARMRPHLRLAAVGTVIAVLDVVAAVWAVLRYPQFAGPDAVGGAVGDEWSVVAAVCAALMLAICAYQLWALRRAISVWTGRRQADLRLLTRISWILHLVSYAVVVVGLWACLAAAAGAGRFATTAILMLVTLVLMIAAQVLAAVQYVREGGPPGTIPSHLRRIGNRERGRAQRYRR